MSGGLFALLDDIAVLVRASAASVDDVAAAAGRASAKAAGVVIDDTAVTPRYVHGLEPARELPIVRRIAMGSLRNKLLAIVPVALLLSQFLPGALTPLLMLGGTYLCFEAAEKVWERLAHHGGEASPAEDAGLDAPDEDRLVASAVRTDFILSAEIMVISLGEVVTEPLLNRTVILVVVAVTMTALVYGVVALIVKMDDVGLHLARRGRPVTGPLGRGLVTAMPRVLTVLSSVGVAAMAWVGGHMLLAGFAEIGSRVGWPALGAPYVWVHHAEVAVTGAVGPLGGVLGWLTNTAGSTVFGLLVGALVAAVLHLVPRRSRP